MKLMTKRKQINNQHRAQLSYRLLNQLRDNIWYQIREQLRYRLIVSSPKLQFQLETELKNGNYD